MPQLNILVVDDDQEVREFLKDFLEGEGYAVTLLGDPTQAVGALKENQYHVVVLDLMMPELSGMDLLSQVRQSDADVAFIILTGHPSLETATSSIELEVSAYIRKPFSPQEFREAIERQTNLAAAPLVDAIGPDETRRLIDLLKPLQRGLVESGAFARLQAVRSDD